MRIIKGFIKCMVRGIPPRLGVRDVMAEAFVRTIKRDYVSVSSLTDAAAILRQLPFWFEHYNTVHPHRALGYSSRVSSSSHAQPLGWRTCPVRERPLIQTTKRSTACLLSVRRVCYQFRRAADGSLNGRSAAARASVGGELLRIGDIRHSFIPINVFRLCIW
jgi:hypothetical protein